jgi:hypothetical protein
MSEPSYASFRAITDTSESLIEGNSSRSYLRDRQRVASPVNTTASTSVIGGGSVATLDEAMIESYFHPSDLDEEEELLMRHDIHRDAEDEDSVRFEDKTSRQEDESLMFEGL